MADSGEFGVASEVGVLRRVLVCAPGIAHERLTAENCEGLLFDEVMDVPAAQRDHGVVVDAMRDRGVEVIELADAFMAALEQPGARTWLADSLGPFSPANGAAPLDLASSVLSALPNLLYTRDPASWIGCGVSVNSLLFAPRRAEAAVVETLYRFHPDFRDRMPFWSDVGARRSEGETIEGGDILVAGSDVVLVGSGERTTRRGVESLASALFAAGAAERVIVAELPHARRAMHLDSVLTFADRDCVAAFLPIVDGIRSVTLRPSDQPGPDGVAAIEASVETASFVDVVAGALGFARLRVVPAARDTEQWNMGANVVAISPGVVIAYDLNVQTNAALRAAGIDVIEVPGAELSRGRGGPHCLTAPLLRDALD